MPPLRGETAESTVPLAGRAWEDAVNNWALAEVEDYILNSDSYCATALAANQNTPAVEQAIKDGKAIEPTNWAATVGYTHNEPGSRLMHYGLGNNADKSINKTVVYANYLVNGNPVQPQADVMADVKAAGYSKMVVGHQPHGDAPTIIRSEDVNIIMGDTSYAR